MEALGYPQFTAWVEETQKRKRHKSGEIGWRAREDENWWVLGCGRLTALRQWPRVVHPDPGASNLTRGRASTRAVQLPVIPARALLETCRRPATCVRL